jgi:hypothetical protein
MIGHAWLRGNVKTAPHFVALALRAERSRSSKTPPSVITPRYRADRDRGVVPC